MTSNNPETELEQKLRQAETDKTGSYEKRTEHLDAEGNANFVNRLILEDSPYLLQHAHNPVNWWAWGAEAFEAARTDHKPIFLSIGYSTCHWCHVMEVESFDNVEIAKLLNNHFVSIKIDREQFPDVDEIYMTGVQIISGQGGWPMSNFLLPDGKPFFAATYFPPPTFMKLLLQIVDAWQDKYPELEKSANDISDAINRILSVRNEAITLDSKIPETVAQALFQREDRSLGGLVGAPKFPQEPLLLFMMDRARRARDVNAMGFVCRALDAMACGGIYDQVAGGFHRYSVDEQWLVPHFEKMLYNQSQLGRVYLEAFRLTGNSFFSRICKQTLDYVLRDMQLPEGGFFSATDADSEGAEGVFFLWTIAELEEVLDREEIELALSVFDITEHGNFEKSNILNLSEPLSGQRGDPATDFIERLDIILEKLYLARERRIHPFRDDKLIVGWTGAMISTLAQAGFYYMNREWTDAAERATQMVYEHNVRRDGRLNRVYLNGATSIGGQLEDFANFIQALLILFSVTGKQQYLSQAVRLMDTTVQEFWDDKEGGFFLGPQDQAGPQLTRSRNASDGATISAIATTLDCLLRLLRCSALCDDTHNELYYRQYIDTCLASLTGQINENSMSHTSL
ncbi:MAG: thioredoxin domain-containing protein, partial [Pseudomonadota bacterium]|nr:thioredoxin domain-containing protein [Pseudomonadota bacterium]